MTTMIDRVARALMQNPEAWDGAPEQAKNILRGMARSALYTMREPTEAMTLEGYSDGACERGSTRATWTAMIDAALQEKI
tara:strand:+ start:3455 stop:3694 length:240 start_codon:yes stop_codon:yes gene_type:complete